MLEVLSVSVFYEVAALLVLASAVGMIGVLLRQPLIVNFIAVGILAGPSALGPALGTVEMSGGGPRAEIVRSRLSGQLLASRPGESHPRVLPEPHLTSLIRRWLKAGILVDGETHPNEEGTSQGGRSA